MTSESAIEASRVTYVGIYPFVNKGTAEVVIDGSIDNRKAVVDAIKAAAADGNKQTGAALAILECFNQADWDRAVEDAHLGELPTGQADTLLAASGHELVLGELGIIFTGAPEALSPEDMQRAISQTLGSTTIGPVVIRTLSVID